MSEIWKLVTEESTQGDTYPPWSACGYSQTTDVNAERKAMGTPTFIIPIILLAAMLVMTDGKKVRSFLFLLISFIDCFKLSFACTDNPSLHWLSFLKYKHMGHGLFCGWLWIKKIVLLSFMSPCMDWACCWAVLTY